MSSKKLLNGSVFLPVFGVETYLRFPFNLYSWPNSTESVYPFWCYDPRCMTHAVRIIVMPLKLSNSEVRAPREILVGLFSNDYSWLEDVLCICQYPYVGYQTNEILPGPLTNAYRPESPESLSHFPKHPSPSPEQCPTPMIQPLTGEHQEQQEVSWTSVPGLRPTESSDCFLHNLNNTPWV